MDRRKLFLGCFISLIATAFGFAVRGAILKDWGIEFGLSEEQKGIIQGVGLYPFAISIILMSLVIDRIGYGTAMVFAFLGHTISAIITIFASSFEMLYVGTFLYALANGIVEAVINPVVATMYDRNKTHWLNVLHAGWPAGLVLGGLLLIGVQYGGDQLGSTLPGKPWQWQMALVLIPTLMYGLILVGQRFPVQERVAAGVSYLDMLREFGWASAYICFLLLIAGVNQILLVAEIKPVALWVQALIALAPTVVFAYYVRSFGRPMFVFLLLVMFLLATTELGTDSWISDIMRSVLASPVKGTLFLVYTSAIMFVLRFFAGPIVHKVSPLGLLTLSAAIACGGLLWLSVAQGIGMLLLAATFYAFGKTFFWPTTLGVVSEQYPRGGALMMNAIAGVGMLAVGVLGNPAIGIVQDRGLDRMLQKESPQLHAAVTVVKPGLLGETRSLDNAKLDELPPAERTKVEELIVQSKQGALANIAILPAIMFVCYVLLLIYFRGKGGYRSEVLTGHGADDEKFTGGVEGPVEA